MTKFIKVIIFQLMFFDSLFCQFQLNGSAVDLGGGTYRMTTAVNSLYGAIWYKFQHNLNTDFNIQGEMNFGSDVGGADGMAFVMQQNCLSGGASGGGLGFSNITGQSFAVEFDTYQNIAGSGAEINNDPNFDHIAVARNGDVVHNASANDITAPIQMHNTLTNVKTGVWYDFQISWNATTNNLRVLFEGVVRVNITYDIQANVFGGAQFAYWGFTSTTGGFNNIQQIRIDGANSSFVLNDESICTGSVPYNLPTLASLAGTNLALGHPVTASSGSGITTVVDGNAGTRWESVWGVDPQWICIDLQGPVDISRVELVWEGAYATAFQIQTSLDGISWTTQYSTTTNTGGTNVINFAASNIRYVRMYGTARSLAAYGYSIWEFRVFGTPNYLWSPNNGTVDDIYGESVTITPAATTTYSVLIPNACLGSTTYDVVITVDCVSLPVELLSFKAELQGKKGFLTWITATERDSDHFDVLKSKTGNAFYKIGEVKAAGNSIVPLNYSFLDPEEINGLVYYRIVSNDINGDQDSSNIEALELDTAENKYIIFENNFQLSIPKKENNVHYRIIDYLGREIENATVAPENGIIILGSNLASADYLLLLFFESETKTIKLTKL